jgi:guanylate kinase
MMNHLNCKPLIIVGASGVGKGTIIHHLTKRYPSIFELVLSYTTRKIRQS